MAARSSLLPKMLGLAGSTRALARSAIKRASISANVYGAALAAKRHLVDRPGLRALREEIELYRVLLPARSLCFDVGANGGLRTEALLRAGHRVVAFEPQPECVRELKARCGRSSALTIVQAAAGEAGAVATLYQRAQSGQSGLVANWEGTILGRFDVPVITLDMAIAKYGVPHYCKIDVEGYELQVLMGLTSPVPLVSIEYHLTPEDIEKTRRCVAHDVRPGCVSSMSARPRSRGCPSRNGCPSIAGRGGSRLLWRGGASSFTATCSSRRITFADARWNE